MNLKLATNGDVSTYVAFMIIMLLLVKVLLSAHSRLAVALASCPCSPCMHVHNCGIKNFNYIHCAHNDIHNNG